MISGLTGAQLSAGASFVLSGKRSGGSGGEGKIDWIAGELKVTHGDDGKDEDSIGSFSSPPCFMHEIDPTYVGLNVDEDQAVDVARWRVAERKRLIADRGALAIADRESNAQRIARDLDAVVEIAPTTVVSLYWPFKGEPDLRGWMTSAHERGARIALPVVIAKGQALVFREWQPGVRMARGVWNIPIPADTPELVPSVVIAPLVGFDAAGYRLGYGGGFFDRTLAALEPKPLVIGVGHPNGAIRTIYPQPHDIPMDVIVTGNDPPLWISATERTLR